MKLIAPDYYPLFKCIADRCRHSCCIGWEIDIDPATREKYRCVSGSFGQRLNAAIEDGEEASSFRLGPDERCPMLNPSGLCDLITELGEANLCQICADHPRFRSFFPDRTEIGLGLCCEEAARIILTREAPMQLIVLEDDGKDIPPDKDTLHLLARRDTLISIMQDDSLPLDDRLNRVLEEGGVWLPECNWYAIYRDLERLDPAWDAALDNLAGPHWQEPAGLDKVFENFCVYLLYRHLPAALEDSDIGGRAAFCVLSTRMLMALCAARPGCTPEDCIELARMYSAEIEYDEDNVAALLDVIWEE